MVTPDEVLAELERTGQGPGVSGDQRRAIAEHVARQQNEQFESQEQRRQRLLSQIRQERESDLAAGRARGQELFGEGTLGRVGAERTADIADVIARRRAGLEGLSAPELQSAREAALGGITEQEQTALRQLRGAQGAQGIRGGLAGAQQAQLLAAGAAQRRNLERDLFLQNIAERQARLGSFETSVQQAEAEELGRRQFDIGQTQRERFGQLATELGFGGLGAQERAALGQQLVGERQAEATAQAASQGGKK